MPPRTKRPPASATSQTTAERLVEAATTLLAEKGPSGIQARSVAEAAQTSTMTVYHHLGGIPELLQAVIDEGFRNLDRALDAVARTDDPVADLFGQALASRYLAQSNPHLYDLMFGLSTRGSYRAPAALNHVGGHSEGFQAPYSRLVEASTRLVQSGRIRSGEDPESVATQLWSSVHGFITLELADHFAQFRNPLRQVLEPMMVNLAVGMGDSREEAIASHAAAISSWRRRVRREQARARAAQR